MSKCSHVGTAALVMLIGMPVALGMAVAPAIAVAPKSPDPGDTRGAKVVKAGWWWLANEAPPETGVLAAPQPPSPNVPKGAMPVGAASGDPEKVSAIEVKLEGEPGAIVEKLEMVLREAKEPGANANAEGAKVVACPVTELFWADGSGAAWKNRPEYDCGLGQAEGKRTKKGLWRFDLTSIATGWLAEGFTGSRSVVLVENVDAPESFEIAFDGTKEKGVGLELEALPAPPESDVDGTSGLPGAGSADTGGSAGSGSIGGSSSSSSSGLDSSGGGSSLVAGSDPAPVAAEPAPEPATDATPAADKPKADAVMPVAANPGWYSGLPKPALLLLPLVLVLAYLIMLSLGPDGRPVAATGRHGVSRALDRLRQAARTNSNGQLR